MGNELITTAQDFHLTNEMDTAEGLQAMERELVVAQMDLTMARARVAFFIHLILEYELWRHEKDGEGNPVYENQKEYIDRLSTRARIGKSTIKAYHSSLRLARYLGYDNVQAITEKGMQLFRDINERVKTDPKTGQPERLMRGQLPRGREIEEYLIEVIEELSIDPTKFDTALSPGDVVKELQRRLEPKKPTIWFQRHDMVDKVMWFYEAYDDEGRHIFREGELSIQLRNNPPGAVLVNLLEKLKVKL